MSSKWVGCAVSVSCGSPLGSYQGTIAAADGATLTLTKAFRNGFPYPKSQVTLNASDIKDLRIIEPQPASPAPPAPAARAPAPRRSRATVCETLQANPSSTGHLTSEQQPPCSRAPPTCAPGCRAPPAPSARSKPMDIPSSRKNNNMHSGSYGSTGKKAGGGAGSERARRRNEACFGDAAQDALQDDFDFEGNLALFDKRAVWASMRNSKPDVVRAADDSKYRHDENVLGGGEDPAGAEAEFSVPGALRAPHDYVTDGGRVVPGVGGAARLALWRAMHRLALAEGALAEVARAAADLALRLVGGERRLDPRNRHQAPRVVALVGAHRGGAAGLRAARLLASRGAQLHVRLLGEPDAGEAGAWLRRELAALALDGVRPAPPGEALPERADLLLAAPYCPLEDRLSACPAPLEAWWSARRGAALCVEPAGGDWEGGGARATVLGGLAVALAPGLGQVYLADVAAPRALLEALGLRYRPPYGAAPALALHPHP